MKENSIITGFHAHIYYQPETRSVAAKIREELGARFEVQLGRWHDQPIGPHPQSMYQVAFSQNQFPQVVPWLMLNSQGLDILVHPETGDDLTDHTAHALWLGNRLELNINFLARIKSNAS